MVNTSFAGYVLLNPNHGSVQAISDTFTQPRGTCSSGEYVVNSNASYPNDQNVWIGPGLYDGTLDFSNFGAYQMGTETLCQSLTQDPVYIPFYYSIAIRPSDPPNPDNVMHAFTGLVVSAGDSIKSTILSSSGTLTFTFTDLTSNRTVTAEVSASEFKPNGAFCILNVFGNLARFSRFTQSCEPNVGGETAGIGAFTTPNIALRAVMVNTTGAIQAAVSPLSPDGATFSTRFVFSSPLGPLFPPGQDTLFRASHAAGYLLLNSYHGSVVSASDSYVQPKASCFAGEAYENATGHYPGDQDAFVGAGLYAGSTDSSSYRFYQVGTEALCQLFFQNPVYIPYYLVTVVTPTDPTGDFSIVVLPNLTVNPGDVIHSAVKVSGATSGDDPQNNRVTFILADLTTGMTARVTISAAGFAPNGAACVMEPIFLTPKFTPIAQSCKATVDGVNDGFGDFAPPNLLLRFDLRSNLNSTVVQARTSGFIADGGDFSITWITSEPLGF
ncbi:MAG: G1 family endopeptidase [Thermoplasmata archaeon]|nr:G1 family endopeptidase [Thermoplasmata archaeon]